MTKTYYRFTKEDGTIYLTDWVTTNEDAQQLLDDYETFECVSFEVVELNEQNFVRGYFFANDLEPLEVAIQNDLVDEMCFNTREELDIYQSYHDSGGHYGWFKLETIEGGVVVKTETDNYVV